MSIARKTILPIIITALILNISTVYCENNNTEVVFWAENEQEALSICEEYELDFLSFCSGIATAEESSILQLEKTLEKNSIEGKRPVTFYKNREYTTESFDLSNNIQWHIEYLKMDDAFKLSTGKGVKVAIIDSGVNKENSLLGNVVFEESTIPEDKYGGDGFPLTYSLLKDNLGHGTHVAGIIGGYAENGTLIGIAPECEIYSFKALEKNGSSATGLTSWIAAAIIKAADKEASVINLSIGGTTEFDEFISEAIKYATEKGSIVVCASGNYSGYGPQDEIDYPAYDENTLAITAGKYEGNNMIFDERYSKFGMGVDYIAPGTDILSSDLDGTSTKSGTSMACAVMSGIIALAFQTDPSLEKAELIEKINEYCIDLGDIDYDEKYGYGVVDVYGLLTCLSEKNKKPSKGKTEVEVIYSEDTEYIDFKNSKKQENVYTASSIDTTYDDKHLATSHPPKNNPSEDKLLAEEKIIEEESVKSGRIQIYMLAFLAIIIIVLRMFKKGGHR